MGIKHDAPDSTIPTDPNGTQIDQNDLLAERDGRLIPETDETGYRIREEPYGTKRKVRVVLMGAAASAANFLKKAEEQMENLDIVVYEKNHDVGGTWLENRYPGCQCDIPSVNYQFSWKIKYWTHYYSYSPEIWEYLKGIYDDNDFVNKYVKLKHKIERVEWNNEKGKWIIQVRDLEKDTVFQDEAEFYINAGGVLNNFKWPDVPGLKDFKGKLMHSAQYEEGYPLEGKKVAVLGAGSSGVQCVARIQPKVQKLYHWIRHPIWITAGFAQTWAGTDGANFEYTPEQIEFLKQNPKKYLEYRKQLENELNQRFKFILKGSQEAKEARDFSYQQMVKKLKGDPRLCEKIIPKDFNPGCRRPTPAPGYLEALIEPNVCVFTDEFQKMTEKGFIDHEGNEHEIDVLICATGFDTTWVPRFPFINGKGVDLKDMWTPNNVSSYLSIGIPTFPNHFSFCGPYGPLGHGSFMPLIEQWTKYMFDAISKAQIENIKSYTPRLDLSNQFRRHADLFLKRTAWTSPCSSWFKQGKTDGQAAIYPGSRLSFLHLLEKPRYEDFEIEYWDDNRYAFLGNGFDTREYDGRDITNYLGSLDGEDRQPDYDKELINKLAGWAVGNAFVGGKYSNFTIECGKRSFKIHDLVIRTQSAYFEKACSEHFKEGRIGKITLQEDDPAALEAMLHCLYRFNHKENDEDQMTLSMKVFIIANKYGNEPLKKIAIDRATKHAETGRGTPSFAQAVTLAYWSEIFDGDRGSKFQAVARTLPNFLLDVIKGRGDVAGPSHTLPHFEDYKTERGSYLPNAKDAEWFCCPKCITKGDSVAFPVPKDLRSNTHILPSRLL